MRVKYSHSFFIYYYILPCIREMSNYAAVVVKVHLQSLGGGMQKVWLISIEKILIFACTYLLTTDYRFTRISSLA